MGSDRNNFYVTLFSNGSQKLYTANTLSAINVGAFAGLAVVSAQIAFLYCDLISPQFVGSQYVRCLRTFVHPTTYCNNIFENLYYMPVEKRRFQDIRIEILRQTGEWPNFKASDVPTNVVLHFRHAAAW